MSRSWQLAETRPIQEFAEYLRNA